MKIRSRQAAALAFAMLGLLSYGACTTDKSEMRSEQAEVVPGPVKTETPKKFVGVYATDDHLAPVYFDLHKAKIPNTSGATVKANADWLKSQPPFLIRIVGFADMRGSLQKNERLAQRRAQALRDAYAEMGIPMDRMSITANGTEDPACQPVTEECLSQSRRAETLLENKPLASR